MLNSRDINLLRSDVAANCKKLIEIAKKDGYDILVTGTVRDDEYQLKCYKNGTSKSKTPSFHSVKAGLAFDICKNKKGEEYSDQKFWQYVGALGQKIGFTWGGSWSSIIDKPHFQWDGNGKYTSTMVRNGKYPPKMPLYGDDEMTGEEIYNALNEYLKSQTASNYAKEACKKAVKVGAFSDGDGDGSVDAPKTYLTREQFAAVLDRLGLLK